MEGCEKNATFAAEFAVLDSVLVALRKELATRAHAQLQAESGHYRGRRIVLFGRR
jgi:hypothetical protein